MAPSPSHELQEHVTELRTTVFGAGGVVQRLDKVEDHADRHDKQLAEHDKKLATFSIKWLILMLLAGIVGNAVGSSIVQTIVKTLTN